MSRGKHRSIKQISNASCQSFQISHPIWNSKIQGTVKSLTIKCYLGIYNYVPYNAFCGPQLWKLLETLLVGNIFNKGLCFTSLSTSSSNNSFTILMPNFMKPIETQSKSVCTQKKKKKKTDLLQLAGLVSWLHCLIFEQPLLQQCLLQDQMPPKRIASGVRSVCWLFISTKYNSMKTEVTWHLIYSHE